MKSKLTDLLEQYNALSSEEQTLFSLLIKKIDSGNIYLKAQLSQLDIACPWCGNTTNIKKNGKQKDGKQRYFCNTCRRCFVETTGLIGHNHTLTEAEQLLLIHCFISGLSVRQTAKICGLSPSAVQKWRNKIVEIMSK